MTKNPKKITVTKLLEKKEKGEPITVLTAYDYTFARIVDDADVDIVLVGDSLGMVVLGNTTTLPVTIDDMVRHTKAVAQGTQKAFLVADMPFLTYHVDERETVKNAGRLMQEGGAEAVKLEGGRNIVPMIKRLISAGIPVMGHLGLTPQSVHVFGGYKVQGRTQDSANQIIEDAKALEEAGCFSIVLECIPSDLAEKISRSLKIPTIGIGAGRECDGQVLVLYDCLGLTIDLKPKFVKQYANLREEASKGIQLYVKQVKEKKFPDAEHSF